MIQPMFEMRKDFQVKNPIRLATWTDEVNGKLEKVWKRLQEFIFWRFVFKSYLEHGKLSIFHARFTLQRFKVLLNAVDKGGCLITSASIPVVCITLSEFFGDAEFGQTVFQVCFVSI